MIDKETLEAISQMIDAKLEPMQNDINGVKVILDTEVRTSFNLLAEGQEEILRRMPSEEDMDIIDSRLETLEAIVKKHSKDIAELKRAN